ncbi:hypothetical protein D9M72_352630 [compost metagenome]
MIVSQLVHEAVPEFRTAVFHLLGANTELFADRQIAPPPGAELGHDRHQRDRHLRETVDRLLLVRGVVRLGQHALLDQHLQPIRQDVGRDSLLGTQQFPEVPFTAEDHVANDQQAPFVAEHFERKIDRATRANVVLHWHLFKTACIIASVRLSCNCFQN